MSTSLLVAKERTPGFPLGLGQKQAKKQKNTAQMRHSCTLFDSLSIFKQAKIKKSGANASQLHAIRCSIDFYVMLCNETAFNPVQTWLSAFAAMCRSTTVGMASGNKYELHQIFGSKPRWTPWSDQELQRLLASNEWEDMA